MEDRPSPGRGGPCRFAGNSDTEVRKHNRTSAFGSDNGYSIR